jgi:hypothetical protein
MKHSNANQFEHIAAENPVPPAKPYEVRPFYMTSEDQLGKAMLFGMAIGGAIVGLIVWLVMGGAV